jgi:hypothetical protein
LGAHVQDLGRLDGEIGVCLMKEALHGAREAGGDLDGPAGGEPLEGGIAARRHLAQVGHRFKGDPIFAQASQDRVLDVARDDLGVLAVAIENAGRGVAHFGKGTLASITQSENALCLDPKLHALVAENPRDISGNVAVGKNRTSSGYRGQDHLPGHERVDLTTMILVVGHALT